MQAAMMLMTLSARARALLVSLALVLETLGDEAEELVEANRSRAVLVNHGERHVQLERAQLLAHALEHLLELALRYRARVVRVRHAEHYLEHFVWCFNRVKK